MGALERGPEQTSPFTLAWSSLARPRALKRLTAAAADDISLPGRAQAASAAPPASSLCHAADITGFSAIDGFSNFTLPH